MATAARNDDLALFDTCRASAGLLISRHDLVALQSSLQETAALREILVNSFEGPDL